MRPFDINEIKVGDLLQCKDPALKVEIICKDAYGDYPIVGKMTGHYHGSDYKKHICFFTQAGVSKWSCKDFHDCDLVMPDYTESVDVYIHRNKLNNKLEVLNYVSDHKYFDFIKKVTIQI